MRRPCTINVWNEPVQEIFCVVKNETPLVSRWKFCEFQNRKSISISGINFFVWMGSNPHVSSKDLTKGMSCMLITDQINFLLLGNNSIWFLIWFLGTRWNPTDEFWYQVKWNWSSFNRCFEGIQIYKVNQYKYGSLTRRFVLSDLSPFTSGGNWTHVTAPKDILTTIALHRSTIEVLMEFNKYFDSRVL